MNQPRGKLAGERRSELTALFPFWWAVLRDRPLGFRKRYCRYRRAYYPRWWVMSIVTAPAAAAVCYLVRTTSWATVVICILMGAVGSQVRWTIWRRRHPPISVAEYIDDMRKAAPWN
jgi:hypothetical protein